MGAAHVAKFASLVGEILAVLALEGRTRHPIEAFRTCAHSSAMSMREKRTYSRIALTPILRAHVSA